MARIAPATCPIAGVALRSLAPHVDPRGSLVEVFSEPWEEALRLVHWTIFSSCPNVLRGVRVHLLHTDYLFVIAGEMRLGLHDLREASPTRHAAWLLELRGEAPLAVAIPPGVAHGEYFRSATTHLHGSTHPYDARDDLSCRWDDPSLGIPWGGLSPILSAADEKAGSLARLQDDLRRARQGAGSGQRV